MKKSLLFYLTCFLSTISYAQNYEIDNINGQTINTCSGTFFDSGGQFGTYQNNENFTVTFCPTAGSSSIRVDFTTFTLGSGDQLCVFDGTNTSAPAFGCFSNTTPASAAQASATNSTGCLTFTFTSSNSTIGAGWIGNISCVTPCQTIQSALASSTPASNPAVNGYIDVCPGDQVFLSGMGIYPQNNTYYYQHDPASTFEWVIEGQTYSGKDIAYVFNSPGGYNVQLNIVDSMGCPNTNLLSQRIRVAEDPVFDGTQSDVSTICIGDTAVLTGNVTAFSQDFALPLSRGDSIFLPDGVGVCYQTSLLFGDFNPGQTINSINDIIDICVNMEHSYMGDLNIQIECPNGSTVDLHQYSGGGGTFLGEPVDVDTDLSPGLGYDYCFTPTAPQTWTQAVNTGNTITVNGNTTLAPGNYATSTPLSGLIGCPLNGTWQIEICDNLAIDNGYIFSWGIQFDPSIYPALDVFTPSFTTEEWQQHPSIVANQGDSIITVVPTSPGNISYQYEAINSFGCSYDTIVTLTVLPFTHPTCFDCDTLKLPALNDTTFCVGTPLQLDAETTTTFDSLTYTYVGNQTIPTNATLDIPINVSGVGGGTVNANTIVSVCVDINHFIMSDVDMWLVAPNGALLELSTDNGGSNFTNTCFTPTATTSITTATSGATGSYQPEGNWSALNGSAINGTWYLRVMDDSPGFDGTVSLASITFNNPYIVAYSWSPTNGLSCTNCPNPIATPATTTTYTVMATDNLGCSETESLTVTVVNPPAAPVLTCGSATAISLNVDWLAIPNTAGYEVNVNNTGWIPANGTNSHSVTGLLPSQSVQVQVRSIGAGDCALRSTISTINCTALACDLTPTLDSVQQVSCLGGNDGILYLSVATSAPSFSFNVNGTAYNTSPITGLAANLYTIITTDAYFCADTFQTIITAPAEIVLTTGTTAVTCNGGNDGTITVSPTGGVGNYSYQWNTNPVQNTATATGLTAGIYIVTVTDGNNCSKIIQDTIVEPTLLTGIIDQEGTSCYQGNDGKAWITPNGGTLGYSYEWNNIGGTDTLFNQMAGEVTVRITDANNCIYEDTIIITEPPLFGLTIDSTDVSCFDAMDGTATITTTGGTAPYTYLWNTIPAQDSIVAINLSGGNYTVTATDANGCQASNSIIINEPTEIIASFTTSQVTCFGLSDGDATVFPSGGVGGYSYQWQTTPIQTTSQATNIPGGNVGVIITDNDGCSITDTANIFAPVLIDIDTIYSAPASCFGSNDGSVGTQVSGGSGNFTYAWSNNSSGNLQFNLYGGMYSMTVTDFVGCQAIDSVLVQKPDSIEITFLTSPALCNDATSGSATAQVIGGTMPYNYQWNSTPLQNTSTANNIGAGLYEITVTDAQNCIQTDTISVTEPTAITLQLTSTPVTCNNDSDGSASVIASGGLGGYSYLWNTAPANTTASPTGIAGGLYTVSVTDINNCTVTDTITVFEPLPLSATTTNVQTACFGTATGTSTINAVNGNGGYTYNWNTIPVQTTMTAINLAGGTYQYTVTDSKNCTYSNSTVIHEPQALTSTMVGSNVSCNGGNDGTATAIPLNGTAPYTYHWNTTTQTDSIVTGLGIGVHLVTITDAFGCTSMNSITLIQPAAMSATFTPTNISCNGGNNGAATVLITGGTSNYTYDWHNNNTTATATNLQEGWQQVTVTDANDCVLEDSVLLTEPTALTLALSSTDVGCINDGTTAVFANGGVGNFTYVWNTNPPQTTATALGLGAGMYTVTVTDGNNCVAVDSILLQEPIAPLEVAIVGVEPTCFGFANGSATANPTYGIPGYTYNWSNNQTTKIATGLVAGTYIVTVTDSRGCFAIDSIIIEEPSPLTSIIQQQGATCHNGNDGQATIFVSGGTPDANLEYSYVWSTAIPEFTNVIDGLDGGQVYNVTVTDANGCMNTNSITINQPVPMIPTANIQNVTCNGAADGAATILMNGGAPPFQYDWGAAANNQTTPTASNLDIGDYNVTITDTTGCTATLVVSISEPSPMSLEILKQDVLCKGDRTGTVAAKVAGGTPWYRFQWSANAWNADTSVVDNLFAGTYTLTVTDGNDCTIIDSIKVEEPKESISATYNIDEVTCYGDRDGKVTIETTGGVGPYTYSINGQTYLATNVFQGLTAGEYDIFVQDNSGCILQDRVEVIQPDEFTVDLGVDIFVPAGENVQIVPTIQGGTLPYFYNWMPSDTGLSCYTCPVPVTENLQFEQRYFLTITDAKDCKAIDDIFIRVEKDRIVYVATGFSPNNDGTNDYLYVQGGDGTAKVTTFQIFDRWGEKVFESADTVLNQADLGWNGYFKGKRMNNGVYAWRAVVEFTDGETLTYSGNTTLIR